MLTNRTIILGLLLVAATVFSLWLTSSISSKSDPTQAQQDNTHPDAYMAQAVYSDTDKQGHLSRRVDVPLVVHYPKDHSATFTLPVITKNTLHITTDHAQYQHDKKLAVFTGHVHYTQGTAHAEGNLARVYLGDHQTIKKIKLFGQRAHYWTTSTANKKTAQAFANTIIYVPHTKTVRLIGNAEVHQHHNVLTGSDIVYNVAQQTVVSHPTQNGVTTMLINP